MSNATPFLELMRTYFRGEAYEAWLFITPMGAVLIGLAIALLRGERTGFDWGFSVPAVVFGIALIATGLSVGLRTPKQVQNLEQAYETSPTAMAQDELPRMEKVMKNFRTTYYAFGGLIVLGLLLVFAVRAEWSTGIGMAMIFAAATALVVDGMAERRGAPYLEALSGIAGERDIQGP